MTHVHAPHGLAARVGLPSWAGVAVVSALALAGCNPERQLYLGGVPGVDLSFTVTRVVERGAYLDVTLEGAGSTLRGFVANEPRCRAIATPETEVDYRASGALGEIEGADGTACPLLGTASLADWRDRHPTTIVTPDSPLPRERASYRVVYEDEDVVFLRGWFPLGARLGWTGSSDTIAVVENDARCRPAIERETSTMQFRPAGEPVLSLLTSAGPCAIVGLVQPGAPAPRRAEPPVSRREP